MGTKAVTSKKLRFGSGPSYLSLETIGKRVSLPFVRNEPRDAARRYFLERIAALEPRVLRTLAKIDASDAAALAGWAGKWHLGAWEQEYARETLNLWSVWPRGRGRVWSPNPAGLSGAQVFDTGRPIRRPVALRVPVHHFDWLVQRRVWRKTDVAIAVAAGVDPTTVRRALKTLETRLY